MAKPYWKGYHKKANEFSWEVFFELCDGDGHAKLRYSSVPEITGETIEQWCQENFNIWRNEVVENVKEDHFAPMDDSRGFRVYKSTKRGPKYIGSSVQDYESDEEPAVDKENIKRWLKQQLDIDEDEWQ